MPEDNGRELGGLRVEEGLNGFLGLLLGVTDADGRLDLADIGAEVGLR